MRISKALQPGDIVLDTSSKMTRAQANALRLAFDATVNVWLVRYVFYGPPRPIDIDADELNGILAERIGLFLVQHPPGQRWTATADLGKRNIAAAISQAQRATYITPAGGNPIAIISDMEDIANEGAGPLGYQTAWRDGCGGANYGAAGYLGFACGLLTADAQGLANCAWWCDPAPVEDRPKVDYALKQEFPFNQNVGGIVVDKSTVLRGDVIWGLYDDGADPVLPPATDPHADP